jgi:acetyltransferase
VSIASLDALLPPHCSHADPVDILGDADAKRFGKVLDITLKDPHPIAFWQFWLLAA